MTVRLSFGRCKIAYRVTKAECLDLPQITEKIRTVELEPKAMKLYKQLEKESFAELAGSEVSAMNVLTKMLRLSQMTGGHLTDDEGDTTAVSTAKLDALSDILDTMLTEDKKLVIMARFVPELNDIQKLLEKKNIGYASVRGGISDRAKEIRKFQEDADCRVFVGQIAAAGLGITLTAASTMVFYSLIKELESREILTPSGKKKWCNQSVVKILTNEKYIGNVLLKKTYTDGFPNRKRKRNSGEKHQYLAEQVHPEIISKEMFDAVQKERQKRSNVEIDENGIKKRASKRYCSKNSNAKSEPDIHEGAKSDESEKL